MKARLVALEKDWWEYIPEQTHEVVAAHEVSAAEENVITAEEIGKKYEIWERNI